jgi:phosphate starvation-inducible PhoH-like protein
MTAVTAPPPDLPRNDTAITTSRLVFDDNALLARLFGPRDQHLHHIETTLGVTLVPRGNEVNIAGTASASQQAQSVLNALYDRLGRGQDIVMADVEGALRIVMSHDGDETLPLWQEPPTIRTRKRQVIARTIMQGRYINALQSQELVFGIGPAGTGKTYLAVAAAVDLLMTGQVQRIILSRPAVEAGERLGFLPGDMKEKVDPYLRPLYDALHDMLPGDQVVKRLGNGDIEVAPLAFMRGRTLSRAFVILDEAQNTTAVQMKMFLTRLGEGSRMAITGDLSQIDLPRGTRSGLLDALETLEGVEGIGIVRFGDGDVVRHPLVARIVRAYDAQARRRAGMESGEISVP